MEFLGRGQNESGIFRKVRMVVSGARTYRFPWPVVKEPCGRGEKPCGGCEEGKTYVWTDGTAATFDA